MRLRGVEEEDANEQQSEDVSLKATFSQKSGRNTINVIKCNLILIQPFNFSKFVIEMLSKIR